MPNYAIGFKAFRIDDQGRLRYLFRAHEGTSLVQLDTWMTAKQKWVREAQGRKYRSGFHFLRTDEHIEKRSLDCHEIPKLRIHSPVV